jgi:hypothetical protein
MQRLPQPLYYLVAHRLTPFCKSGAYNRANLVGLLLYLLTGAYQQVARDESTRKSAVQTSGQSNSFAVAYRIA